MRKNIMVKKLWKGLLTVEFLIYACKIRENFYEETFQKKKKIIIIIIIFLSFPTIEQKEELKRKFSRNKVQLLHTIVHCSAHG